MGGGGGGTFGKRSAQQLREIVRKADAKAGGVEFESMLGQFLGALLSDINDRDTDKVNERLESIKNGLEGSIDGSFDRLFGGSVAKHTYVDGISDIDSIVVINGTDLEGRSPRVALERMENVLKQHLAGVEVTHGRMAVTIQYEDGMKIQLLPAIKTEDDKLRVPSSRREAWSKIDPIQFQAALTRRNAECGGKLIPTIKLAKAINGQLPEGQRLSGYHMESLAIEAFRGYNGQATTREMLPRFFERAAQQVLNPIRDRTGQSIHVDEYLGPENSEARQVASHLLNRLARRMENAVSAGSIPQWKAIFGVLE